MRLAQPGPPVRRPGHVRRGSALVATIPEARIHAGLPRVACGLRGHREGEASDLTGGIREFQQ